MKSILGILTGYFSIIFLEGFIRLVISVYHRIPISFSGLDSFPSNVWYLFFLALMFIIGAFGNMLNCTIAGFDYLKHSISLSALFLITRGLSELIMSTSDEYFKALMIPVVALAGIFTGYLLIRKLHSPKNH